MIHLLYFVVMAAAMMAIARVLPGFKVEGWIPALFGALVLALVNTVVRPILTILTLPFTILTFGLFLLVINAACLWLAQAVVPGFKVTGFGPTVIASILLSAVSMAWRMATGSD